MRSYGSSPVILTLTLIAIGRIVMASPAAAQSLTADQLLKIMQDNDETCE
jgi:hypothetical protein